MESSAAMTKTMLDDAEVMHGLGPVPLLQRQSAVESRWTRTVADIAREREKSFPKGPFLSPPEMDAASSLATLQVEVQVQRPGSFARLSSRLRRKT